MTHPPLYILRHGQTEWNAKGLLQGHHDSALTSLGRSQAIRQRNILQSLDLKGFSCFCSPQDRAVQTAKIALEGVIDSIKTDDRLREIGLGDWAGQDRAALVLSQNVRSGFDLYERAPKGEGFEALRARCTDFLTHRSGPAVIVTHGITSRMLRLITLGMPTRALQELPGGQGVVFRLLDGTQTLLSDRG